MRLLNGLVYCCLFITIIGNGDVLNLTLDNDAVKEEIESTGEIITIDNIVNIGKELLSK